MKCQGKEIRATDTQECSNEATGMFKLRQGNILPLCQAHSTFAKENRLLFIKRDNYFGLL